jgi:hypothetical protein
MSDCKLCSTTVDTKANVSFDIRGSSVTRLLITA